MCVCVKESDTLLFVFFVLKKILKKQIFCNKIEKKYVTIL